MSEELPRPERHGTPLPEDDPRALPVLQIRQETPSGTGPGRPPRAWHCILHGHGSLRHPQAMSRSSGPPPTPSSLPASFRGFPGHCPCQGAARQAEQCRAAAGGRDFRGEGGGGGGEVGAHRRRDLMATFSPLSLCTPMRHVAKAPEPRAFPTWYLFIAKFARGQPPGLAYPPRDAAVPLSRAQTSPLVDG